MRRQVGVLSTAAGVMAIAGLAGLAMAEAGSGDAAKGAAIFDDRCSACHAIKEDLQGPHLGGVVGRKAASVAGVDYTDALKASGVTWTPDKLDQFLTDPGKMVAGTAMPASVPDPVERRNLIAYLASTSAGGQ
jgi:cytochrome c2